MKLSSLIATILFTSSSFALTASAQDFETSTAEEKEAAAKEALEGSEEGTWTVNGQGGWILTTGNSETNTISGGADVTWKKKANQFKLEGGVAWAQSSIFTIDPNAAGFANQEVNDEDDLVRDSITTTRAWRVRARYDRFLTLHNSIYAVGFIQSDVPAGKDLVYGGQAGYSRQLIGNDRTKLVAEIGYDFSAEDPVVGDSFQVHSARGFLGYSGKLSDDTSLDASVEGLTNVSTYEVPLLDGVANAEVDTFEDYRILSLIALTTKLRSNISFRFGFEARYDNVPNPLGLPGITFNVPVASSNWDTKTDASIIISFL